MVKVRVRDFQSIKEAEVEISGLTVITGPNNSGKTAFMRAVKGVFTNAAPGPLVRKGCGYLSVEILFEGGDCVLWEKGTEKPYGKGKTINRYVVNGVSIQNVGRGVPPEVEGLGVREVKAASDRVWPQIAQQFEGTLFLVNRPGSSVAEALADVERVGRLTDALKLSEKDRRATSSELKVRRKDLEKATAHLQLYGGLGEVSKRVGDLVGQNLTIEKSFAQLEELRSLTLQRKEALDRYEPLRRYSTVPLPPVERVQRISQVLGIVRQFKLRRSKCVEEVKSLESFTSAVVPDPAQAQSLSEDLREMTSLRSDLVSATSLVAKVSEEFRECSEGYKVACDSVSELLGGRGMCPVCDTIWEGCSHD